MTARLEHANITVPDIDAAIEFLLTLEPGFRVRHDSGAAGDYRWVHIGTDESYIALEEPHEPNPGAKMAARYADYGINHLGWVVDDVAATCKRLDAKGFQQGYCVPDPQILPRRRRIRVGVGAVSDRQAGATGELWMRCFARGNFVFCRSINGW